MKRFVELDSLRGIAALAVFFFHVTWGYDNGNGGLSDNLFYFRYGYLGVRMFFIISGFVIYWTLEKKHTTKSFTISRFSRLYPVYWFSIIYALFVYHFFRLPVNNFHFSLNDILWNLTMVQTKLGVPNIIGVYWTLGVELTFYIIIFFLFRMNFNSKIYHYALAILLLQIPVNFFNFPYVNVIKSLFILKYWHLFLAGIFLFRIFKKEGNKNHNLLIIALTLIMEMAIGYSAGRYIEPIVMLFIFILVGHVVFIRTILLQNKMLVYLGKISYSFYLIHQPISFVLVYYLREKIIGHTSQILEIIICLIITLMISSLSYFLVEIPALKYIRKKLY